MTRSERANTELARRQRMEMESWRSSPRRADTLDFTIRVLNKAPALLDLLDRYQGAFVRSHDVLELGAGTGWASCIVKRQFPQLRVTATDMSADALARIGDWERTFDVKVDEARTALSYDTGLPDSSFDLVFAFASAHHFVLQGPTLKEISRILRPGGRALYLYEPSCPDYLYPLARRRVAHTRGDVVEDTLRRDQLVRLATNADLTCAVDLYPSLIGRGPIGTIYNWALLRAPALRGLFWCGANFEFIKQGGPPEDSSDGD